MPEAQGRLREGIWLRRDSAPHRGRLLLWLSWLAIIISLGAVFVVPVVISIPFSALIFNAATKDLRRMAEGAMDPQGERATFQAQTNALVSVFIAVQMFLAGGLFFLIYLSFIGVSI